MIFSLTNLTFDVTPVLAWAWLAPAPAGWVPVSGLREELAAALYCSEARYYVVCDNNNGSSCVYLTGGVLQKKSSVIASCPRLFLHYSAK